MMFPVRYVSRRNLLRASFAALLAPLRRLRGGSDPACTQLGQRMLQMENWRTATLKAYEVTRHYSLRTDRAEHCAEMEVHVAYESPGRKYFRVLWEAGSALIQNHVFHKLILAEQDAAREGQREQTRICERNYQFQLHGTATLNGRSCYVIGLTPRSSNRYLINGRAWIDQQDIAISRIEGRPARSPSFWLRSVKTVQEYRKIGPYWLPCSNQTETEVRLFGRARLNIQYRGYRVQPTGKEPIISD
jgi:hypothetical protein